MNQIKLPLQSSNLLEWAKFYASLNWPIIPLHVPDKNGKCSCLNNNCTSIGKHPRTKNGFKDATFDLEVIKDWWIKWPDANIGVVTGKSSGKIVVDIDPKNGGLQSLNELQSKFGELLGDSVRSGGNGLHFYFDVPKKLNPKNKVNLLPGIDIRSNGGYIVAPPSLHKSGKNYQWNATVLTSQMMPDWLLNKVDKEKIFKNEEVVQKVITGARNNFLASIAGTLRRYGFDQKVIKKNLNSINKQCCYPQLTVKEINSVAKSISKYKIDEPAAIEWQVPKVLPKNSYETPVMDESYIPEILKDWIFDISKRMQVPYEFIATPAIVSIGSVIGRKLGIYPKQNDNWLVVPNLWGGIVAGPGSFKSPSISEALRPLEKIVAIENEDFKRKMKEWEVDKSINEATLNAIKEQLVKAIKKDNLHEVEGLKDRLKTLKMEMDDGGPTCKRLKTNDATVEKISQLLLENPNGILVLRDELAGWLSSLNKYGRDGDREFYLESWNGYGSYTVDRIGRGTVHVPSLCLSIFGGIQPDKLKKLLTNALESNDDGLLQRFQLLIYPEIKGKWKNYDCSPDFEAQEKVFKIVKRLHSLDLSNVLEEKGLRFSKHAQQTFNKWREKLEDILRSGQIENSHYESHLSKYRSLMPSLALIFQLLEDQGNVTSKTKVSDRAANMAIKWCNYLDLHAKKIYQVGDHKYHNSIQAFVSKVKNKKIKDGDNIREIYRHNWQHLNSLEKIENTISFLIDYNWIKVEEVKSGRRSARIININPNISSVL